MRNFKRLSFVALIVALLFSLAINVLLYGQFKAYYRELNEVRLDPLGLNHVTQPQASVEKPVVIFFGDSRAAQWPAPHDGVFSQTTFVNLGMGAQTSAQVLGRFDRQVPALHPNILILQVGINDLKTIPLFPERKQAIVQDCKSNIRQIVAQAVAGDAEVIVTTIFPLGQLPIERELFWSADVAAAIQEVNADIKSLAGDHVTVMDTSVALADQRGLVHAEYQQDFLHLNAAGYAALNQQLTPILAVQLGQRAP